jgi:nucleoid-associated protein YgaU
VTPGRDAAQPDELYIVAEGDTLYEIARTKLGDGERYTELMEINRIANINDIAAGQVIRLV